MQGLLSWLDHYVAVFQIAHLNSLVLVILYARWAGNPDVTKDLLARIARASAMLAVASLLATIDGYFIGLQGGSPSGQRGVLRGEHGFFPWLRQALAIICLDLVPLFWFKQKYRDNQLFLLIVGALVMVLLVLSAVYFRLMA
ncbi:MAG: hypothetical protein ACOCXA_08090 [Planctomycetota bacterium]